MAVAALVSKEIYNFSELLEQPSLVSLKTSENWMYELLEIFNKGDIQRFERFDVGKNVSFFINLENFS
jgi:26S proteasome regulatory subunit N9